MDFSFSEEQRMLQDSAARFVQNSYSFDHRRKLIDSETGYSEEHWSTFAELGWLALPFPEEVGGFGGTAVDTMILMEEFGKALILEPYLSTIVLAGTCLNEAGSAEQKQGPLAELLAGSKKAALAFVEPQARFDLADVTTTARGDRDFVLNGHKSLVLGGPTADYLVVPARTSGSQKDPEGITLFLVDAGAAGVTRRDYRTIDGHRASEVTFDDVKLNDSAVIGDVGGGFDTLATAVGRGILAVCAEAVGAMEVMYKTTVEYCQTREQFGQPIGKFQVLQHRMVDMFMEHEQIKSLLFMAAMKLDQGVAADADRALSALKVRVGRGGRLIGQSAIQLHGGMGMTEEMAVGHYFKRVTAIDALFGNHDHHLRKYANIA